MDLEILSSISSLTQEDLQQEYKRLYVKHQKLNQLHEDDLQQIYELQRNLKISKAAEDHLAQEIDIISSSQNLNVEKLNKKLCQELDELKKKTTDIEDYNEILEKKVEVLQIENDKLQQHLNEVEDSLKVSCEKSKVCDEHLEKQQKLETENLELYSKLNELEGELQKSYMFNVEKERQIEVLREDIQCFQENLNAKKVELEEKSEILESLQDRLIEINSELASLKMRPDNENRKGNSLFAEVDDQRQVMKKQLVAQKKSYLEMKKIYEESQYIIRRLKHENSAIQSEIQACSTILLSAKKFYEDKLVQTIAYLSKQKDVLEKKLQTSQERLISLAENNDITWLDSMMTFCKNETKEMKIELQNIRLQKGILEKNYRESQEELARWRFEALKSRFIIKNRETLLEENLIAYKDFSSISINLSKNDIFSSSSEIVNTNTKTNEDVNQTFGLLDKNINQNEFKCTFSEITSLNSSASLQNGESEKKFLKNHSLKTVKIQAEFSKSDSDTENKTTMLENDKDNPVLQKKLGSTLYFSKDQTYDKENQNSVHFSNNRNDEFKSRRNVNTFKVTSKKINSNIQIKKIVIKSKEENSRFNYVHN